jgi:beta-phosphoglucomutase-like phosphatase (HAD superfamily)
MNEAPPSAFTCLVIDHDDTSVASTPSIHHPAHVEALRRLRPGHPPISLEGWFRKNFNPGLMGYLVGELGYTPEEVAVNNAIWRTFTASRIPPFFPGFLALLAKFRQGGGLVVVVSHSETEKIIRDYLADLSLGQPFLPDAVIGWNEDPRLRKPSAYPALAVMERFSLRPEQVLVLDDLKPGLDMALAAGVRCAGAGWGHDIDEIRSVMRACCHWYFETLEAFSRFLFGQA